MDQFTAAAMAWFALRDLPKVTTATQVATIYWQADECSDWLDSDTEAQLWSAIDAALDRLGIDLCDLY